MIKISLKWRLVWPVILLIGWSAAPAEFTFSLIDNFESGSAVGWYRFGNLQMTTQNNPSQETTAKDTIAESCGDYSLNLRGSTTNWYVGGIGKILFTDASPFSRLQMDVCGSEQAGKIKIELFVEALPGQLPIKEDKWAAEIPVLGKGFTRFSIPFSAFKLEGVSYGYGIWKAGQENGSKGLTKLQFILLTDRPTGEARANIDNILLTY